MVVPSNRRHPPPQKRQHNLRIHQPQVEDPTPLALRDRRSPLHLGRLRYSLHKQEQQLLSALHDQPRQVRIGRFRLLHLDRGRRSYRLVQRGAEEVPEAEPEQGRARVFWDVVVRSRVCYCCFGVVFELVQESCRGKRRGEACFRGGSCVSWGLDFGEAVCGVRG